MLHINNFSFVFYFFFFLRFLHNTNIRIIFHILFVWCVIPMVVLLAYVCVCVCIINFKKNYTNTRMTSFLVFRFLFTFECYFTLKIDWFLFLVFRFLYCMNYN